MASPTPGSLLYVPPPRRRLLTRSPLQCSMISSRTRSPPASHQSTVTMSTGSHNEAPSMVRTLDGYFSVQPFPSDLADHIRHLSLEEPNVPSSSESDAQDIGSKKAEPVHDPKSIGADFSQASEYLRQIRRTLFQLEEVRHAQASSSSFTTPSISLARPDAQTLELALVQVDDRLESLSTIMQRLEAQVPRNAQVASPSNLAKDDAEDSDDDADFCLPGLSVYDDSKLSTGHAAKNRRQLEELNRDWTSIQAEIDNFRKELADDKYISHFHSASTQAQGLMDSLEKALKICQSFIAECHAEPLWPPISGQDCESDDAAEQRQERLQRLVAIKKAFVTKRNYYTPACEQTFSAFERSLRERATSHGMLLRTFSELKTRWNQLREMSSKMSKELKRIETKLCGGERQRSPLASTIMTPQMEPVTPSKEQALNAKVHLQALPGRSMNTASKGSPMGISPASSASSLSPSVPVKPQKSPRRITSAASPSTVNQGLPSSASSSSSQLSKQSLPPLGLARHHRSISANLSPESALLLRARERFLSVRGGEGHNVSDVALQTASPLATVASSLRSEQITAPPSRRTPHSLASKPPSSFRFNSQHEEAQDGSRRFMRAGSEPPANMEPSRPLRPASVLGASGVGLSPNRAEGFNYSTSIQDRDHDADNAMEILTTSPRPGSAASCHVPTHYRPPSSATTYVDPSLKAARQQSRIPTLAFPSGSLSAGSSDNYIGARPSSSISHVSNGRPFGASRSTMQTPEPTIAARVQRLSVYTKPSTGAPASSVRGNKRRIVSGASSNGAAAQSRPPITASIPRSPAASFLSRSRPASSMAGSVGPGVVRATPLSASALAKVPQAAPAFGSVSASAYAPSTSGSSVANYRLSRYGAIGTSATRHAPSVGAASVRDGAATPTLSESGLSAYSGVGLVRHSQATTYHPNPNDALDVEISHIVNALGVPLTRIDSPLPRGFKTETGPGKELRCRYAFGGGNAMTCKLLELHRPSLGPSPAASGTSSMTTTKQRKVLVKVPGKGFVDLELWLLSALD